MLQHIKALLAFLFGWIWRRPPAYRGKHVANLPDKLARDIVYIVGADGYDWSAAMLCPGRCGKTLEMNLLPDAEPFWTLREHHDQSITLRPSVWLKTGCGCHYVLTAGRVHWV